MDYARKIGKTGKEPKLWDKHPVPCVTVKDPPISQDVTPINEDKRFLNWNKWLANRKKYYDRVKSATGRKLTDQIINSCEKVRPLIEMRELMDYANVPVPVEPDKYRGGPEFWTVPQYLPKYYVSDCKDEIPEIAATPNRKDLNIAPELMHVALPELTEKEKNLTSIRSKEPYWKRSEYLKTRKKELAREIEVLLPKEPEIDELVIKGGLNKPRPKLIKIPPISITDFDEDKPPQPDPDAAIVLKIQDQEITWQNPADYDKEKSKDPIKWNLTFSGHVDERAEKQIVFENKGVRLILYYWQSVRFKSKLMSIEKRTSPFYFNKTKGIVLPGQIVQVKVWYLPRKSGVSSETWKLITDPKLCASPLMFRFWGCARGGISVTSKHLNPKSIDAYLDVCIGNSVVKQILDEIMTNIGYPQRAELSYPSLFLESDLFCSMNPLHHYHPTLVNELREMYYAVTGKSGPRWNFSLKSLRDILLKLQQPVYRNDLLTKFNNIYASLLLPTKYIPIESNKHEMIYIALCSFANLFEMESEFVLSRCIVDRFSLSEYDSNIFHENEEDKYEESQTEFGTHRRNYCIYREIFFVRIYELLAETIGWVCGIIETYNNLHRPDK